MKELITLIQQTGNNAAKAARNASKGRFQLRENAEDGNKTTANRKDTKKMITVYVITQHFKHGGQIGVAEFKTRTDAENYIKNNAESGFTYSISEIECWTV